MKTYITVLIVIVLIVIGIILVNSYKVPQPVPTGNTTDTIPTNLNVNPSTTSRSTGTPTGTATSPAIPSSTIISQPRNYSVSIANFAFNPSSLTINRGDSVTWVNMDSAPHNVSGSGLASGVLNNGQSYTHTFTTAGTYNYICSIHPSMKGQVIVQ